nr:unnamed protein product [Callosobruchus chinensis]
MTVFLSNTITSAANKSCKILTPFSIRNKSPPWWDEECSLAVTIRKEAFKNYKSNLTLANFLEYKRLDALCKRTFRSKAKTDGLSFVATLIDSHLLQASGGENDETTVKELFSKLAPPYAPPPLLYCSDNSVQHFLLEPINTQEMVANIRVSKTTAPGIDGINYLISANHLVWLNNLTRTTQQSQKSQISEPTAQESEPSAEETEPSAQEIEPSAQEIEPSAQESEPSAQETGPRGSLIGPDGPTIRPARLRHCSSRAQRKDDLNKTLSDLECICSKY